MFVCAQWNLNGEAESGQWCYSQSRNQKRCGGFPDPRGKLGGLKSGSRQRHVLVWHNLTQRVSGFGTASLSHVASVGDRALVIETEYKLLVTQIRNNMQGGRSGGSLRIFRDQSGSGSQVAWWAWSDSGLNIVYTWPLMQVWFGRHGFQLSLSL